MNERTKYLAQKARDWAEVAYKNQNDKFTSHWDTPIGYTLSQFFEQKFAELIVRECAEIAADCNSDMTAVEVLKHFGVKE